MFCREPALRTEARVRPATVLAAGQSLPYLSTLREIPSRTFTESTIKKMHQLVRSAKADWEWVKRCTQLVQHVQSKDYPGEAKSLFDTWHGFVWITRFLRYIRDPNQIELVESVWHILERGATDCDGMTVLLCAAWGAVGLPYQFVTVAGDPANPTVPSHVYGMADVSSGRQSQFAAGDLTVRNAVFGWEPRGLPRWIWPEPTYC